MLCARPEESRVGAGLFTGRLGSQLGGSVAAGEPARHTFGQELCAVPDRVVSEFSGGEADQGSVFDFEGDEGAMSVTDEGSVGEEFVLVAGQVDDPAMRGHWVADFDPAVELQRLIADEDVPNAVPGSRSQQPREFVQQPS
jgi:hypothetical protein